MADSRRIFVEIFTALKGRGFKDASRELRDVGDSADRAGDKLQGLADDNDALAASIRRSRAQIMEMHRAIAADPEGTRGVTVFKDLRREESQLRSLMRTAKALAPSGDKRGSDLFTLDFSRLAGEWRGLGMTVLIGGIVSLLPEIGAMIGGAVTGAVGLGGIAGGVAAAAKDPGVKAAAGALANSVSAEWDMLGKKFAGPTEEALRILDAGLDDMDWSKTFEEMLPYVTVLAKGLADMGRNFMPGFTAAMKNAGPFITVMAEELGELGSALGDMFKDMSESPGAIMGLRALFNTLESTITFLGVAVEGLSYEFAKLMTYGAWFTGWLEDIPKWAQGAFGQLTFKGANDSLENLIHTGEGATRVIVKFRSGLSDAERESRRLEQAMRDLSDAFDEYFNKQMGLDQANLRAAQSLLQLRQALGENGRQWDINTEAGQRNRQALLDAVEAYERQRMAAIEAADGDQAAIAAANAQYEAQLRQLEALARQYGINKKALDDLVGDYYIRVHAELFFESVGAIAARAAALLKDFGFGGFGGGSPPKMVGPTRGFAHGGLADAGVPHWVGEAGPELRWDSRPAWYTPHDTSAAYTAGMAASGGGMGGGTARVVVDVTGGDEDLKRLIRKWVRIDGGGDVQVTFGRD